MTTLTKIGNSQGIRIPKILIQQAHLENVNLELYSVSNNPAIFYTLAFDISLNFI